MDKKNITSEIQNLLETITEQTEVICSYEQNIPQIELDIIKVNIRDLYEAYIQLDKLNRLSEKPAVKNYTVPQDFNKLKEEKIIVEIPIEKPAVKEEIKIIEKEIISEPEIVKADEPPVEETVIEKEAAKEIDVKPNIVEQIPVKPIEKPVEKPVEKSTKTPVDLFSETPTMSDKFKSDKQSINDKIAQSKTDASIAGKINRVPVEDLKKAIGINEKFRFVNELFEGNLTDYTDAINKLNTFNDLGNALVFLESMALKHKWDMNAATYSTLKDLVSRKYTV